MERCSTLLVIREIQIKTIKEILLHIYQDSYNQKTANNKCNLHALLAGM